MRVAGGVWVQRVSGTIGLDSELDSGGDTGLKELQFFKRDKNLAFLGKNILIESMMQKSNVSCRPHVACGLSLWISAMYGWKEHGDHFFVETEALGSNGRAQSFPTVNDSSWLFFILKYWHYVISWINVTLKCLFWFVWSNDPVVSWRAKSK